VHGAEYRSQVADVDEDVGGDCQVVGAFAAGEVAGQIGAASSS
jgi:hypothetical protein